MALALPGPFSSKAGGKGFEAPEGTLRGASESATEEGAIASRAPRGEAGAGNARARVRRSAETREARGRRGPCVRIPFPAPEMVKEGGAASLFAFRSLRSLH